MCGNEGSVRIEPADNGLIIRTYSPGGKDKPGVHKDMIATSPEHAMKLVRPHLSKMRKLTTEGAKLGGKKAAKSKNAKNKAAAKKRV